VGLASSEVGDDGDSEEVGLCDLVVLGHVPSLSWVW
jgi:hypothetical protein